jgi:SpoVK/Ycf46/Vps4 family AAA+-type ATPase
MILDTLVNENKHLNFIQKIIAYDFTAYNRDLLIYFCSKYINDNDNVNTMNIKAQFTDEDGEYDVEWGLIDLLHEEHHPLQREGLVENVNENGFALFEEYQLTKKAKNELFTELEEKKQMNKKDFFLAADISEKSLFYNADEERNVQQLTNLLMGENFQSITERLGAKGLRKGFACLFSGAPGTGKTETVYQIARQTKRDIMPVDVSEIKSKWVGDSEKNIRELFELYKAHVEDSDIAPILFFNEADAIMGRRVKIKETGRSVEQMENSVQNIILEEIEKLEGILIATTNLTENLDRAFERRFIYKIKFEKPGTDARKEIWKNLIPELQDDEATILADRFCFSGGQIENIARKRTIETVLNGKEPSLDTLIIYCRDESLEKETARIGFAA